MKYILLISVLALSGCAKNKELPRASTAAVVRSLEGAKTAQEEAGKINTEQYQKIQDALTLAEELQRLLNEP